MRTALRNTLLFVFVGILLDQVGGVVLQKLFDRTRVGQGSGVVNTMLEHRDSAVLIFGSSRARQHVDPDVIAAKTGVDAYNAGANGQGLPYARGVQALALHRGSKSKCHLLHLDVVDVVDPKLDRVGVLTPFLGEVPAIDAMLHDTDPWARVKSLSSMWRFNSIALSVLRNQRGKPRKGYRGFDGKKKRKRGVADDREFLGSDDAEVPKALHPKTRALLAEFVESSRASGATPVWFTSPMNTARPQAGLGPVRDASKALLEAYAAELGVTYHSYDELSRPEFQDSALFVDGAHLHADGATRFTELVAADIARECGLVSGPARPGRPAPPSR